MSLFRWRTGEHEEYIRKINRFNKKIERAEKEGYNGELPLKINYKERLDNILSEKDYSRREFNNQIKTIDIFLEKNSLDIISNKKGLSVPKWEKDTIEKVILKDINKGAKEFKKQNEEITKIKEKQGLNPDQTRVRKLNFENKSQRDFDMFIETFNDFNRTNEAKNKATTEGYFKAIENEIGSKNNVNALALKGLMEQLPEDVIASNALFNERTMFDFVYSVDDYENRFKTIHTEWTNIYKEYIKEEEKKEKNKRKTKKSKKK
jgi:hypothetical protein